jgi:hypothetical protein
MANAGSHGKINPDFIPSVAKADDLGCRRTCPMMGIALISFIGVFAFGHDLLGWSDAGGNVQLGLFMAFLFGIVCGYRTRG